jgi:hypothetical protein
MSLPTTLVLCAVVREQWSAPGVEFCFLLSQPDLGDDLSEYLHFWIRIVSAVLSGTGLRNTILSEELK